MSEAGREQFQQVLRKALDAKYPGWQIRHSNARSPQLPDAETLKAWVETTQRPQFKTFSNFLKGSEFSAEVRHELLHLYQALPAKKINRKSLQPLQPHHHDVIEAHRPEENTPFFRLAILFALLLVAFLLFGWFVLNSSRGQPRQGWCAASASWVRRYNHKPALAFDALLPLQDFSSSNFFIYFDGEYVGGDDLHLALLDTRQNVWIFEIASRWTVVHQSWTDASDWVVHYVC